MSAQPQPAAEPALNEAEREEKVHLTPEQYEEALRRAQELQGMLDQSRTGWEEAIKIAQDILLQKEREVTYWKFEYFSMALVYNTKRVLAWFEWNPGPVTTPVYDQLWAPYIQNPQERQAIITVLLQMGLLTADAVGLRLSELGRQFLAYSKEKRDPAVMVAQPAERATALPQS